MGNARGGGLDRAGRALRDLSVRPRLRAQRHGIAPTRMPLREQPCRFPGLPQTPSAACRGCSPTPCLTAGARPWSMHGSPPRAARSRASTSWSASATSARAGRSTGAPASARAGLRLARRAPGAGARTPGQRGARRSRRVRDNFDTTRPGGDEGDPRRRQLRRRSTAEGVHRLQRGSAQVRSGQLDASDGFANGCLSSTVCDRPATTG